MDLKISRTPNFPKIHWKCLAKHLNCISDMGVSKNRGTPKWMVYRFGGTPIFGNTHILLPLWVKDPFHESKGILKQHDVFFIGHTYFRLIFIVNVSKYTIHGSYGLLFTIQNLLSDTYSKKDIQQKTPQGIYTSFRMNRALPSKSPSKTKNQHSKGHKSTMFFR